MAPLLKEEPEEDGIQVQAEGSLYQFDPASKSFTAISSRNVEITLYSAGSWTYWLWITLENGSELINIRIGGDLNYTQLAGECAFSFATCRPDEDPKSWKFSFDDKNGGSQFMKKLSTAVWQQQHEVRLIKVSKPEKKPLGTKIGGTGNAEDTGDTGETDESSDTEDEIDSGNDSYQWKRQCNKEHSSKKKDNVTNSGVAVGLDSTFVIRGSSLGVFRNLTEEGQLEFETNVSRIQALTGKYIKPAKIMLYRCERFMILQEANEPNLLHQMNLEIGKIDETWYFGPENLVETFAPETKYAQLYDHRTLIGASQNTLYRIDPREPHGKIVSKKSYRHPKKFSSLASTPQGYLAVGSTSGDIRLFDRIGVIAKTHIPKLDEKIRGIDVSNDGRWVLATCSSCLLLVDSQPNEMGNAGINGFRQRFPHKYKPQPLRLRLKENDIKRFGLELMKFTHARFISDTEGVYISSSTGSFLVMWDLQQVLAKRTYPYRILPLENTVVGTEGLPSLGDRVVVAGTNTVNMFSRTDESLNLDLHVTI
ncbi:VID27-domain-containing protein [Penicillium alfredii]|uniref:VID27-domain-containing protein n=1 Tax=Penicillium alfredii TaxID=1506179 RepID=A0A9W9G474_9EURO|nr:VID27-domain-containing protein [Penicillium alfredii]KAJ5111696.1 VID27-domain-containing protein [Penicillium alfredii]